MTIYRAGAACAVLGALLLALRLRSFAQEDLDSLKVCRETQKLVFENAFVRVIDDVIPPGGAEPKHRHPHGLVVALVDAEVETTTYPEGRVAHGRSRAGGVNWAEPLVHEVRNVGTTPTHWIRIDLK